MQGLTKRQQMVLDVIVESIREKMYPPTLREIGKVMGIKSTNGVNDHLRALERKGFLLCDEMKSRGIRLTERTRTHYGLFLRETPSGTAKDALKRVMELAEQGTSALDLSTSAGAEQGADTALRAVVAVIREEMAA